jgi:hypothetical protein
MTITNTSYKSVVKKTNATFFTSFTYGLDILAKSVTTGCKSDLEWCPKYFPLYSPETHRQEVLHTGYFTSDNNQPDEIENATHNTFAKLTWMFVS